MTVLGKFINKGLTIAAVLFSMAVIGQDAHFSQYFRSPLQTNPALTGQINGSLRLNLLYRNQWASVGRQYDNYGFSADVKHNEWGFGITAVNQVAGSEGLNTQFVTTNVLLSAAYDLSVASGNAASNHHFVFGIQAGVINKYVKLKDATYTGDWDNVFGFQRNSSGEGTDNLNSLAPDLNFGFLYFDGSPYKKLAPFAGLTVNHLISPSDDFDGEGSTGTETARLPLRYSLHGGVRIKTTADIDLTPHALVMIQNNNYNIIAGVTGSYALIDTYTKVEAGVWYRVNDAIVPYVGLRHKDIQAGVSYDVVLSDLNDVGRVKNALEISLTYILNKRNLKEEYICPRL